MVMQRPGLGIALAALALAGCSETKARTQLMLVADTNIPNLNAIQFEVSDEGRSESAEATTLDAGPATLAVVPTGDELGPLRVTAYGVRRNVRIVERSAVVSFVPHQTRVVELHLLASCIVNDCGSGQTCTENDCQPEELSDDDLPSWSGEAPRLDTGTGAAGEAGADAATDAGSGTDAGRVNCGADAASVDLETDINHCGSCANVCKAGARNTQPVCSMGDCGVECRALWEDCDGNEANGCEQTLTADDNCGMCDLECPSDESCFLGSCR
jgi:hypothetical protein